MTKEEILKKQMDYVSIFDEDLKDQTIHIKGHDLSVKEFTKTLYERALNQSFDSDAEKYYSWQEDGFDEQFLSYNWYLVIHYYKDIPDLCYLKNDCFHRVSDRKNIRLDEVVAAKRIEYPEKYLKAVHEWRETNQQKVMTDKIVDSIMSLDDDVVKFAKNIIRQARNNGIDLNSLIDELYIQGENYE